MGSIGIPPAHSLALGTESLLISFRERGDKWVGGGGGGDCHLAPQPEQLHHRY